MSRLDDFEDQLGRVMDGAAGALFKSTLNPVQIMKRANKEMNRGKLVFEGKQFAPTLYSVLVNQEDDRKLAGFYPTMAGEMETALRAQAQNAGLEMDGDPLVRFIADPDLKRGKFDVIAENVAASIVSQLRSEEMARYGLADQAAPSNAAAFVVGGGRQQGKRPRTNRIDGSYVNTGSRAERSRLLEREQPSASFNPGRVARSRFADEQEAQDGDDLAKIPGFDEPKGSFSYDSAAANLGAAGAGAALGRVTTAAESVDSSGVPHATLINLTSGNHHSIDGFHLSIGRERGNDMIVRDANISRNHAEILFEDDGWFLRDLGSTNGTFLNDEPIEDSELFDGDVITFGLTSFEFRMGRL